jgi:hypothetical protein
MELGLCLICRFLRANDLDCRRASAQSGKGLNGNTTPGCGKRLRRVSVAFLLVRCEKGPPEGGPSLNSSSRQVSEIPAACDDVLLVNRRRHELETVPPHDVLNVVRVRPEGVEKVIGASGYVGIIAKEATTEAVTCVDVLSAHRVRAPAQVADDVVEPRVVYVGPKKVTCYATNRRRRPGKARLPRRNHSASVSAEINVAICGNRRGREYVLDRTKRRWGVKRRAIAAVSCLTPVRVWVRCWLRDRIAIGGPARRSEHGRGIGPGLPGIG